MKYLFITALAACISTSAFAQEKKEARIKLIEEKAQRDKEALEKRQRRVNKRSTKLIKD